MKEEKVKEDKKVKVKNPIDCLFDENDTSAISLYNEKGEEVKFEQIAIIPMDEKIYAILKPLEKMEFIGDDEALVFEIVEDEEGKEEYLSLVSDIDTIDKTFAEYNRLMDEEDAKQKISKNKEGKK